MKIIVGLGNPGRNYEDTRHNIGFNVIDALADRLGAKVKKIKFKGLYDEIRVGSERVILLKPQTYMNNSGESVREVMSFYKVAIDELLVIVDDIDIVPYTIKMKAKGSAGTHNGLKSIIYHLQDDHFARLKVGVGNNENHWDLAEYVLSGFPKADGKYIEAAIERACDSAMEFIEHGAESAMNKYNG
ncbi:aminoacyl-tRNA hydrolase [Peptoniphilus equinus]|uniref:Peptidyl-tRNA hydrolase n=1 Tax=Peptoniphilus equinus TaxID=3016343 RepID=A0ABY7QRU4_9FIRM|nr:aminoacyl-tRNA hydrolase [Peptoniphilus equinus]WBW49505.1 aminoacyl-tRNA hydrolase [Peptoniphilus equinus]